MRVLKSATTESPVVVGSLESRNAITDGRRCDRLEVIEEMTSRRE